MSTVMACPVLGVGGDCHNTWLGGMGSPPRFHQHPTQINIPPMQKESMCLANPASRGVPRSTLSLSFTEIPELPLLLSLNSLVWLGKHNYSHEARMNSTKQDSDIG